MKIRDQPQFAQGRANHFRLVTIEANTEEKTNGGKRIRPTPISIFNQSQDFRHHGAQTFRQLFDQARADLSERIGHGDLLEGSLAKRILGGGAQVIRDEHQQWWPELTFCQRIPQLHQFAARDQQRIPRVGGPSQHMHLGTRTDLLLQVASDGQHHPGIEVPDPHTVAGLARRENRQ